MKLYLAGLDWKVGKPSGEKILKMLSDYGFENVYALSSFYTITKNFQSYIPQFKDFLLDSGAYSFMKKDEDNVNWDEYLERYAEYINRNDIEKYFELDIDPIVGYDKVKEYRYLLEKVTGRRSIPVWHKSRGLDEFLAMCEDYEYAAIGDIVIGRISVNDYKYFPYLIREAHKRGCRIHGLGITGFSFLKQYHFDTVDSSSWSIGGRYGKVYTFQNGEMRANNRQEGTRVKNVRLIDAHNLAEFLKYQKYAEVFL